MNPALSQTQAVAKKPESKWLWLGCAIPPLIFITTGYFVVSDMVRQAHLKEKTIAEVQQIIIKPLSANPFGPNKPISKAEAMNSLLIPVFDYAGHQAECYFKTTDGRINLFENPFARVEVSGLKVTRPSLSCQEVKPAFINGLE